jgi:heparan-alpha-glucosaminide N-acetyltransferase
MSDSQRTDTRDDSGTTPASAGRLVSLDAMRGLIMCTLALNGLALAATAKNLGYGPAAEVTSLLGRLWQSLAFHSSHPAWNSQFYMVGCSYWDLIQPAFMFMVGVAMPYSYAKRRGRGDSNRRLASHALRRAIVLVLIGVFLQTRTTGLDSDRLFTNVLAQIGLGYFFVFLLLGYGPRLQIVVGVLVLVASAGWMLQHPAPDPLPESSAASIESLSAPAGVAKHFAIHTNAAADFDQRLFHLLRRDESFQPHPGGYATLNFVPSAITMLLGVLAGSLLRASLSDRDKLKRLILGGLICMAIAVASSYTLCPVIKRIWTPAWALYSGAWVLWCLAGLYWLIDVRGWKRWTYPLVVVGMNSMAMYLMTSLLRPWIAGRLEVYLGDELFAGPYGPMIQSASVFAVLWFACAYLFRQRIFFRI